MALKYRILQDRDGNNSVESFYESRTLQKQMWIWVATFKSIDEARRLYPGASEPDQCTECLDVCEPDHDICQSCCDHSDQDDYCCLICGREMLEDRMAMAYDRAKAARQDG